MKKTILCLLFISTVILSKAQNGLENIIVEKYYISDENDTTTNLDGGILTPGSVTYRIYADMLPGYKFQAAYGIDGHELRIATSTVFFNNEDRGAISPTYTKVQAAHNTVMLDSWLTAGAASADNLGVPNNFGILKSEDNGVNNIVNSDGILQNADPLAGIPLTTQDGLIAGTPEDFTKVGIDNELEVFNNSSTGNLFSTVNGSWAALNGATGPTPSNRVLIAQITTDGIFSFELNIQVGTPGGSVQNYVARNPVGSEIQLSSLIYQNIPNFNLNLKAFIQGFYIPGMGTMNAVIDPALQPNDCDTILLGLAEATSPYSIVELDTAILHINGSAQFQFLSDRLGGSYYIVLFHRNSLETWSKNPVVLSANMKYDFSSSSNQAFDDGFNLPMKKVESSPEIWAIFNGDITGEGGVDALDMTLEEGDSNTGAFGYNKSDLNGDGGSDSLDMTIIEDNSNKGVFKAIPIP